MEGRTDGHLTGLTNNSLCLCAVANLAPPIYVSSPWPGAGIWANYTVQLEVTAITRLPK